MLIITGHIAMDPDKVDEATPHLVALMEATRAEEGCVDYVLSPDPSRPGVVCISERWETQEALNSHMKAPHTAEFQSKVAGFGVTGMSATSYEAASEAKLI